MPGTVLDPGSPAEKESDTVSTLPNVLDLSV